MLGGFIRGERFGGGVWMEGEFRILAFSVWFLLFLCIFVLEGLRLLGRVGEK